jgi:hypothetical protein
MPVLLGAISSKKISKGYYYYSNKNYIVDINNFDDYYGGKKETSWTYQILRKSDGLIIKSEDVFSSKKACLKAVEEHLKEL